jgi:plastocyanin
MKNHQFVLMVFHFRRLAVLFVLIAPCSVWAQSWQATAGAQSDDLGRQAMAFLPNEIWIHAGDSITWKFDAEALHTVTFLKPAHPPQPAQTRPPAPAGCATAMLDGATPDGGGFDGNECVNSGRLTSGHTYSVFFPEVGNFKLVCLVHPSMTGVVHVRPLSELLPHDQDFYDHQAAAQRKGLLSREMDHGRGDGHAEHSQRNRVTTGVGEIVATPGGTQTLSVMRFMEPTKVIHAGETVEWNNSDPVEPHTITFGTEPANLMAPSVNVSTDQDGARIATITSASDSVHSGFIVGSGHERTGVAQAPLGVTRFRVTFTQPGVYPYICALHDEMGMTGEVIVLP